MKNRDQQLIWEAFDMSRRTFLSVLAKASAALKSGISDVTGVDVADLDKVSKAKPWFKSMTIVADPEEFWGTGDHAGGDIPEVHMGNDTSSDILSQVNKSSKLLDFGDGVIVDVDGSTPYDFKVHVDMNSPFGSLLKVHEEDPDGIEGEDIWRFDWQGGGGMPQDDRIEYAWYQHPVIGPLYKKIGMTLYNDPEWLALQLREHLEYKQSLSKHYTYNNYRELNDMLDSEMKPMTPYQVNIAKMSDAEYIETRILPDYNSMYEEITLEDLPKETIDIVVSQYSTAIPEGPPPEQQEFDFDKEDGKEFDSDKEEGKKRFIPGPTRELKPHATPTGLGTFESRMKDKDANLIWEAYEQLSESLSKGDVVRAIVSAWTKSEGDWDTLLDYLGTIRETTNHQTWLAATGDIFRMHHDEVPRELLKALSLMDEAGNSIN